MIQQVCNEQVVNIQASNRDGETSDEAATLLSTGRIEVVRLMMPAGKEIPTYSAAGEMTVQCLEGRVDLAIGECAHHLEAGQLLHVCPNQPHSIRGVEDGSLLLTILLPASPAKTNEKKDEVQLASEESFPASDPPAWTGVTGS